MIAIEHTPNDLCMINCARPRRRRAALWKCAKTIGIPCVSCMGTHRVRKWFPGFANGFPKFFKSMENEAKSAFPCAQTVKESAKPKCRQVKCEK